MPKANCKIEGCEKPRYRIGWCSTHFQRWEKTGDPLKTRGTPHGLTPMERFMRFVRVDPATGCWMWTGSPRDGRYGIFKAGPGQRNYAAHRWIYLQFVGPIPEGLQLDHFACDRTLCVNPEHLRPVTARENSLRSSSPVAFNAGKAHCVNGHPLSGDNLRVDPRTLDRICRTCARENMRRYRAAKHAA